MSQYNLSNFKSSVVHTHKMIARAVKYFIILTLINNYLYGQEYLKNYKVFLKNKTLAKKEINISFSKPISKTIINFYQDVISPTKASTCRMYPSCSEYGKLSIIKYGLIKGSLMIADRLNRCGHDLKKYEIIKINDIIFYLDRPEIEANHLDFIKK